MGERKDPPAVDSDTLILFFKCFDRNQKKMSFMGSSLFKAEDSCQAVFHRLKQFEEIKTSRSISIFLEIDRTELKPMSIKGSLADVPISFARPLETTLVLQAQIKSGAVVVVYLRREESLRSDVSIKDELEKLYRDNN